MWRSDQPVPARPDDVSSEEATTGKYRILWVVVTLVVGVLLFWRIYQCILGRESLRFSLTSAGLFLLCSSRLLSRRLPRELLIGLGFLLIIIGDFLR